jgi:hypothetical protein
MRPDGKVTPVRLLLGASSFYLTILRRYYPFSKAQRTGKARSETYQPHFS